MFPTRYDICTALGATIAVSITSIWLYNETARGHIIPSANVLASVWAILIFSLDIRVVASDFVKSTIGAAVGAGIGSLAYLVSSSFIDDFYPKYAVSTALTIPFAFVLALALPECHSPLSRLMRPDTALLSMYLVCSFGKDNSYNVAWNVTAAFAFGSFTSFAVALLVRPFFGKHGRTPSVTDCWVDYRALHANWFEGLTAFMTSSTSEHAAELDYRQTRATMALRQLQGGISALHRSPFHMYKDVNVLSDFNTTIVLMHSQMLAFRKTIEERGYVDENVKRVFSLVREEFANVRMTTVLALRTRSSEIIQLSARHRIVHEGAALFAALSKAVAESSLNTPTPELDRLIFALTSVVRLSYLIELCLDRVAPRVFEEANVFSVPWSLFSHVKSITKSLFSREQWKKTHEIKYAIRAVVTEQIAAQLLLLATRMYHTDLRNYVYWAQLTLILCFLRTVGQSVIKGSRRLIGTLISGALAALVMWTNQGERTTFYAQTLIVTFIGKLASMHPKIGYAGVVMGVTFFVVVGPNLDDTDTNHLESIVAYRVVLTLIAVLYGIVMSTLLVPSYSTSTMRKAMARTIRATSLLVTEGIRGVSHSSFHDADEIHIPTDDSSIEEPAGIAGFTVDEFRGAGGKALNHLYSHYSRLHASCEEAQAEKIFLARRQAKPFHLRSVISSEDAVYRLVDATCVLSAIAAATRVSKEVHELFMTDYFRTTLQRLTQLVHNASTLTARIIEKPEENHDADAGKCGIEWEEISEDLQKHLFSVKVGEAHGEGMMMHVFHFSLVWWFRAWDNLEWSLNDQNNASSKSARPGVRGYTDIS